MKLQTNLAYIAQDALDKGEENFHFKEVLQRRNPHDIDNLAIALNAEISPKIDCTACGNCCKTLMINVTEPEVEDLSAFLKRPADVIKTQYIETSMQGNMIVNTIPCHFLHGTRCSIYDHRFTECRDFPGLHRPCFVERSFATFMHYGRCPIVYNVVERLKAELRFIPTPVL